MIKKKFFERKQEIVLVLILMVLVFLMGICFPRMFISVKTNTTLNEFAMESNSLINTRAENQNDFIYLSDIDYIASQSRSGWGSLLKDQVNGGGKIAVKVEGAYYTFDKGMWAHATSQLVYDISAYDYDYFTAFIGLNQTAASSSNGVKFYIYTSVDGSTWNLQTEENPAVKKAGENATFVKINIKDANYLKLIANDNGANGNDHAVYADAKLTNEEGNTNITKSVSEYDEQIKREYTGSDLSNPNYELLLLQRNLVNNMGQYAIKRFVEESTENKATFNWLFNNLENLRLYTLGGAPEGGSYYNSLTVLKSILEKHISDFDITEETKYGTRYGDLYKRMAIALSLTHSKLVGLWMQASQPENKSDAVTRYEIYKMMHKNNKFVVTPDLDITKWFENYTIEEMRFVMNNNIDDEEILWLNEYTQSYVDKYPNQAWKYLTPHPYMAYVWPNYSNPIFHDPERKDYWDEKFNGIFSKYDVTYRPGLYKVWMNFRNEFGTGAVCGGISKTGSNIRGSHGIPSAVIGQPGHAAIIYYTQDANTNGYWNIDNDVSGWTLSEKGERMLLGWGNASFSRGYSVVYMALSQEVLNNYDTFEQSEKLVYLADVYHDNLTKQEELYKEALRIQPLNINAWYGLIQNFNANPNKTEENYYNLAKDIGESLKYFPLPMQHLTNLIKPKLTSAEYGFKFTLLQTRILTEGGQTPNNTTENYYVYQPGLTRLEANYLLGKLDKEVAGFSFDGENANKIMLASRFNENGVRWDYSLDGKQHWKEVYSEPGVEHSVTLTPDEIANITADNDIYVHIVGANYDEENVYKIDITNATLPTNLYANDLENRVIGVNTSFEWRNNENDPWTSYATSSPNNTGDKTLQVRVSATGTTLPSDVFEATFTEDNQLDTQKYIRISHLSIHEYSTQSVDNKRPFYAENVIDGNINTLWNTDFRYNVLQQETKPFITIKLDEPTYLSVLEFVQKKYRPDNPDAIKTMIVSVSQDGNDWKEAGRIENISEYEGTKRIEFAESIYGQYVKLEMETYNIFASLAMVNLFEDTTKQEVVVPTAGIAYDITTLTRENVIARLVNPSTHITITNNNGSDTYIFTENDTSFTFEFEDDNGIKGSATASVNWIDREAPTASIEYDIKTPTTKDVVASLVGINEDVYLLDEDNNKVNFVEVKNGKVSRIEYLDLEGNITKILYLNSERITEKIEYYYRKEENLIIYTVNLDVAGNVISSTFTNELGETVIPEDEYEVRKLDAMGRSKPLIYTFEDNGEYIFRLQDKAGNQNEVKAKVNWIDREIPTANITYNITIPTTRSVVATITLSEAGTILNNNGSNTYTFTENGEFTFKFQDLAGNISFATAKVDWIQKKEELPNIRLYYSEEKQTKNPVTVMLINQGRPIKITNNNGSNTYTFLKNGEFTFEYIEENGKFGSITAKVNWIIEKEDENNNNNQQSNTNTNTDNKNNGNKWTASTNTKKPTTSTNNGTINVSTNSEIENNNPSSDINTTNKENNNQEETKTEEKNQKQEEIKENNTKQEMKSKRIKIALVGFMCFIAIVSIIRYRAKKKKSIRF